MIRRFKIATSLLTLSILLYACGGSSDKTANQAEENAQTESAGPPIDISAKNETKGIGKFSSVTTGPINVAEAEKGQEVFMTTCANCHRPTEERLIGPGLKGVTTRRTPEWILNMITNPDENLKKDPLGKALLEEYSSIMPYLGTTDEQARQILEYLRQNDSN